MIESQGIATVVIGLVRPHMEKTKPPRGLWVPFPLGRPLGEPEDPAFQRRVLTQALGLLERSDGPVLLVDFPDDAPTMRDAAGWTPPTELSARSPSPSPTDVAAWIGGVQLELSKLGPRWRAAQHRFGRTTVGNARMEPAAWLPFAARFLNGEIPHSPIEGISSAVLVRYIADDLKALYAEVAQAKGPQPSSAKVNRWFWDETLAADFLRALRRRRLRAGTMASRRSDRAFLCLRLM